MFNLEDNVNNWPKTFFFIELFIRSQNRINYVVLNLKVYSCFGSPERKIGLRIKRTELNISVGFRNEHR